MAPLSFRYRCSRLGNETRETQEAEYAIYQIYSAGLIIWQQSCLLCFPVEKGFFLLIGLQELRYIANHRLGTWHLQLWRIQGRGEGEGGRRSLIGYRGDSPINHGPSGRREVGNCAHGCSAGCLPFRAPLDCTSLIPRANRSNYSTFSLSHHICIRAAISG